MGIQLKNGYLDQVPAANTTLYTCPAGTAARVMKCTATNDTTTVTTITVHKVESGGAVDVDRAIINGRNLGSNETYECPEIVGQVLDAGDFISAIAGVATQILVSLDVVEITNES